MAAELPTTTRGFVGSMNPIPTSKSTNMNIQEVVEDEEDEDDAIMGVQDAEPEEMTIENTIPISTPTQLLTNKETKDVTMDDFMQSPSITAPVIATEETLSILHPDVLIVESTYGVQVHASRTEREARFTSTVERIVTRGGNCLIPVFALGRAQELLLILDEYWQQHSHLQNIPIWYASKLASRALRVYQTYANMMNARIRAQMDIGNPFAFQYIRNLKSIDSIYHTADSNTSELVVFDDRNNANVVFASPGMLQSGVSRRLFDRWASDPKNGVIVAGYAVEHTLAKEILNGPKEVVTLEGKRQPLACLVDYISFSAHVDFMQNRTFITKIHPKHIILVHGSKEEMVRCTTLNNVSKIYAA
jgi:Cft2 family RNA processing exonuclease